jgi:hypothetical protein
MQSLCLCVHVSLNAVLPRTHIPLLASHPLIPSLVSPIYHHCTMCRCWIRPPGSGRSYRPWWTTESIALPQSYGSSYSSCISTALAALQPCVKGKRARCARGATMCLLGESAVAIDSYMLYIRINISKRHRNPTFGSYCLHR